MKIAIVYESATGNTKALAQAMEETLAGETLVYVGGANQEVPEADLYLVGSWTDKGMCTPKIGEFLQALRGKQIAFFGTAGFGGSQEYFDMLFQRVAEVVDDSNQLLGSFYCQGKMPPSVKQRYERLLGEHPGDAQLQTSLENFDRALSHPDEADLESAKAWAKEMVAQGK